jgi:hypothetical protein
MLIIANAVPLLENQKINLMAYALIAKFFHPVLWLF